MRKRLAILQVADQGPTESLAMMLRAAGIEPALCSPKLRDELKRIGCDTVLSPEELTARMGYDPVFPMMLAGPADMSRNDVIYIDVKAHRSYGRVVSRWPNLHDKVLWYRINGGEPEHVIKANGEDCGDELDPPCPIVTPNQHYKEHPRAYTCWPPFVRFDEYTTNQRMLYRAEPICLIHNVPGWGYRDLLEPMKGLGVKCYGVGSPDGLVIHSRIVDMLRTCLAMVHLKSSDAPGYAIYECLAAACPLICTRRLIWRCRMQDLLIPNETCLVFDRETHEGLTEQDVKDCTAEVSKHLTALCNPEYNRRIGEEGRKRLLDVMWKAERDGSRFAGWLDRMFP